MRDEHGLPASRQHTAREIETMSANNKEPKVRTRYNLGHWEAMQINLILNGDPIAADIDFRKFLSDLFHTENATFSITVTTDNEDARKCLTRDDVEIITKDAPMYFDAWHIRINGEFYIVSSVDSDEKRVWETAVYPSDPSAARVVGTRLITTKAHMHWHAIDMLLNRLNS